MSPPQEKNERVLNINVGVLGHVDSGKTSLVKTLSTLLSTASLDKSAQSRQRGITLDLGFSAFFLDDIPPQIASTNPDVRKIQITLVDCPGHASLIRTIIGGAQIIDMMILVVDATKGLQTQTAECLVIAEMTTKNMIVALNKIDLFPPDDRVSKVKQVESRIRSALRSTRFADAPMVGISACVGGEKVAAVAEEKQAHNITGQLSTNIDGLLQLVKTHVPPPNRNYDKGNQPFHFAIDHCFPIKGQGTVITGTALNGSAKPNDFLQFPELGIEKKIKSMQMFRRPVTEIHQGDRAGICIANLDAKLIERGVASTPGTVSLVTSAIAVVRKVKYFNGKLQSNSKFHVSVGHNTVMASVIFFGAKELAEKTITAEEKDDVGGPSVSLGGSSVSGLPRLKFNFDDDFLFQDDLIEDITSSDEMEAETNSSKISQKKRGLNSEMPLNLAVFHFQTPVFCPLNSLVIGSRLDTDIHANTCRLAFSGRLIEKIDPKKDVSRFKFYSRKEKEGVICRLGESYMREKDQKVVRYEVFGVDLFKKETNMNLFVGLKVETSSGDIGVIHSSFGTSGKFRMHFPAGTDAREGDKVYLRFKRYANDTSKSMHQDTVLPEASPGVLLVPEKKSKKEKKKNTKKKNDKNAKQDPKTTLGTVAHEGVIASLKPNNIVIVSGFFSPEVNIREKVGWKVVVPNTNEEGVISAPFGKAGKCKVLFEEGISAEEGSKVQLVPPAD